MLSLFPQSFSPVSVPAHTSFVQVLFLDEHTLDLLFELAHEGSHLRVYCCVFGSVQPIIHRLRVLLSASHTSAEVYIWSIALGEALVSVDGSLDLGKNIQQVHGSLHQSHIICGSASKISLAPVLRVASHDVQASHGAQIQALDEQHLFYMMAKGLSLESSQKLVVQSLITHVLDQISDMKNQEKEVLCAQIMTRYF